MRGGRLWPRWVWWQRRAQPIWWRRRRCSRLKCQCQRCSCRCRQCLCRGIPRRWSWSSCSPSTRGSATLAITCCCRCCATKQCRWRQRNRGRKKRASKWDRRWCRGRWGLFSDARRRNSHREGPDQDPWPSEATVPPDIERRLKISAFQASPFEEEIRLWLTEGKAFWRDILINEFKH